MKYLFTLVAMFAIISSKAATINPDSINTDSTGITIASDTVLDDTSNYTISTKIPKNLTTAINDAFDDNDGDLNLFGKLIKPVFGMIGVGILSFLFAFFLLPLALIALIIWLILRGRHNARKADLQNNAYQSPFVVSQSTPDAPHMENHSVNEPPPTPPNYNNQKPAQSYTHRRDNAILNSVIGVGIIAASAIFGLDLGIAIGVVVLCVGVADYLIYYSHRNDNK